MLNEEQASDKMLFSAKKNSYFSYFSTKKIYILCHSLEAPRAGTSNDYHNIFLWRSKKNIMRIFPVTWSYVEYQKKPIWDLQKLVFITKTRLFNYIENFTTKTWKLSDKNF